MRDSLGTSRGLRAGPLGTYYGIVMPSNLHVMLPPHHLTLATILRGVMQE